jgi:hypothetical protein
MPPQPSAFRLYAEDHPQLTAKLSAQLQGLKQTLLEQVVYGNDWGDFNVRKGRVLGVMDAIKLCEEIERELNTERR